MVFRMTQFCHGLAEERSLTGCHSTPLALFSPVLSALKRNGASRPVFNSNQITGLLAQFGFNKVNGVGCHWHVGQSCLALVLIAALGWVAPITLPAQETKSAQATEQGKAKQTSPAKDLELTGSAPQQEPSNTDMGQAQSAETTASPSAPDGMLRVSKSSVLVGSLTVFLLSVFVGFEVIAKVPPTLHTPLMSGSNAISGITVIGAMLTAGSVVGGVAGVFGSLLGLIAVVLAMINVVGGFLVTHRMLMMFKKR